MVIFNENIYFCCEKIDNKQKPANTDDIRWFGVLVDYCLMKVSLVVSVWLICTKVFPSIFCVSIISCP